MCSCHHRSDVAYIFISIVTLFTVLKGMLKSSLCETSVLGENGASKYLKSLAAVSAPL